jgi:hypothetical protein
MSGRKSDKDQDYKRQQLKFKNFPESLTLCCLVFLSRFHSGKYAPFFQGMLPTSVLLPQKDQEAGRQATQPRR